MNCLVTGGSGFLGSHLVDQLTKLGFEVTIFDKKKSKWNSKKQNIVIGDLSDLKKINKVVKNSDYVFHFAGFSDLNLALNKPRETAEQNILGTINILEACRKFNVKRIIHASSIYVNSTQGGFYRSSKRAAEDYIEEYQKRFKLNYTILRFGSLYGERSNLDNGVKKIIASGKKSRFIKYLGDPRSVRKYIYVKDAARACIEILTKKYENKHLLITGHKTVSLKKLLNLINKFYKNKKKIKFMRKNFEGHYLKSPFNYRFKKGMNYITKNQVKFEFGLRKVFNETIDDN